MPCGFQPQCAVSQTDDNFPVFAQEFNANLEKENQKNRYLAKKIRKPVMELGEMMDEEEDEKDVTKIKALVSQLGSRNCIFIC
jgi:hypothetical protein